MSTDAGRFHKLFERWASRVRARITLRRALTGLAIGLVVGALASIAAWQLRQGAIRPWMAAAGAIGMLVGVAFAVRKRWSDTEVALYLDGKLQVRETITTAVELRNHAEEDEVARAVVVRQAAEALEKGNPKTARPRVWSLSHLAIPIGAAALVMVARMPLPAFAVPPPPPGSDIVRLADVDGLDKIAELGKLQTPDDAQRERLKKIAQDAEKLKEKLREGMERREAQDEIAKLRDAIAAERFKMGTGEQRAGLEAARGRLAQNEKLKDAAEALGDRDLTRFDEEMQKLANELEKQDRDAAKEALEEAAEAAKKEGAEDVAKMLEEQKRLMEERSKRGEALREFADAFGDALPPEAKKDLEDFNESGSDKDGAALAEKMADALGKLTPEERKRLAERLADKAGSGEMDPMAKEQLQDLIDKLDTPEGQKQLEDMLRKMANEPPESDDAERERALGEAEKGAGEAEGELGGAPVPIPMGGGAPSPGAGNEPGAGDKPGDSNGSGKGKANDGSGSGGPGSHHDTGRGDHNGSTPEVDGDGFRSRAGGKLNPGAPMPGVVTGRGKGRAGDSANVRGLGGVGEAAPGEVGGVERSEIPEEYREQVGRYFSP